MPLYITRGDITQMEVDAIVNTDYPSVLSPEKNLAIYEAAGPELEAELRYCPLLKFGEGFVTPGFDLPAKYIIHTLKPKWKDSFLEEEASLAEFYRLCLLIAVEINCSSVALPVITPHNSLITDEIYLKLATDAASNFLQSNDLTVFLVAFPTKTCVSVLELLLDVHSFASENYIEFDTPDIRYSVDDISYDSLPSLEEMLRSRGETFSCMLDRLRDERGMTGPELYKKAWVHKSVYSKIMHNINYQPAKITTVAFALALELPWNDFTELVSSAGYAMTHTSKFDIVVEFFVKRGDYDIEHINAVLFELDPELPLIGF